MKRLLILRHAQALSTEVGGNDKTRKLSPNGIKDAQALGDLMVKSGYFPDYVLCSSATRTRETLDLLNTRVEDSRGNKTAIEYSDALYNADFGALLHAIQNTEQHIETLLLVAHNPGIHTLAARLTADNGSALVDRLLTSYAPATLTVLSCDIENWSDIQTYTNAIEALHETIDYNTIERPTRWM